MGKAQYRLRMWDQMRWRWHKLWADEKKAVMEQCLFMNNSFPRDFHPKKESLTLIHCETWLRAAKEPLKRRNVEINPPKRRVTWDRQPSQLQIETPEQREQDKREEQQQRQFQSQLAQKPNVDDAMSAFDQTKLLRKEVAEEKAYQKEFALKNTR